MIIPDCYDLEGKMAEEQDFERMWLEKFSEALEGRVGPTLFHEIMDECEGFTMQTNRLEIIDWTQKTINLLEEKLGDGETGEIFAQCACRYPVNDLQEIREMYARTGDLARCHQLLEKRFITFLKESLNLTDHMVEDIVGRGWGLAGVLMGNSTIIATKIPKSGNLKSYLQETDLDKKRQAYCHCPRVRDVLKIGKTIPESYCCCGAGFYQRIWEEIVQGEVEIEVLESVLAGGDVCRIAVRIMNDDTTHTGDQREIF
jgi:hypothetical protein